MSQLDRIIDYVYDAALDNAAWPQAIGAIRTYFGGTSTGLYLADLQRGSVALVHICGIDPRFVDSYVDRYLQDNPWSRVAEMQQPGCIRTDVSLDRHFKRPGYYRSTEFFNDWMRPQDFIHTLGVNLTADRHLQTKVYVYRSGRSEPFARRDVAAFGRVSRHLQNAVRLARRLGANEARNSEVLEVLEQLHFGVALLDEHGAILHANRFASRLFAMRDGLAAEDGKIMATQREGSQAVASAIRAALELRLGGSNEPGSATVSRPHRRPLSVFTLPLRRGGEGPFSSVRRAAVALMVTDPEVEPTLPAETLRSRYRFGSAEVRLAQSLSRGLPLREAADTAGLTYETARWYLKAMFQKTGTARQADLIRLLLTEQCLVARC